MTASFLPKKYDVIFSIGHNCDAALALRRHNIRLVSGPLDWVTGMTFAQTCAMIVSDFDSFFEKNDLHPYRIEEGEQHKDTYKNSRNNLLYPHDFMPKISFDNAYKNACEKYARRISRFRSLLVSEKNILLVYMAPDTFFQT